MQSAAVKLIQRQLSTEGFAPGDVDGKLGSNTYAAVEKALLARSEKLPPEWQGGVECAQNGGLFTIALQ